MKGRHIHNEATQNMMLRTKKWHSACSIISQVYELSSYTCMMTMVYIRKYPDPFFLSLRSTYPNDINLSREGLLQNPLSANLHGDQPWTSTKSLHDTLLWWAKILNKIWRRRSTQYIQPDIEAKKRDKGSH